MERSRWSAIAGGALLVGAACSGTGTEVPASLAEGSSAPSVVEVEPPVEDEELFGESMWSELCDADSPKLAEAREQLEQLDAYVQTLGPSDSALGFEQRLEQLLAHDCFDLARADRRFRGGTLEFGVEVQHFWDSGADVWLGHYLDLADGTDSTVWMEPSRRHAWTPTTHPKDPLAQFLCAVDDEGPCAERVRPFVMRASRFYELWTQKSDDRNCEEESAAAPAEGGYAAWRDCTEDQLDRATTLPLGGLGVVDEGWLVVEGRRGHYGFCDGLAAYDLATGAAYRFDSCSELELHDDGHVDQDKTDAGRVARIEVGVLPLSALREAAWGTLSAPHADRDVVIERALGSIPPSGMKIGRRGFNRQGLSLVGRSSSGHTQLSWQWMIRDDARPVAGELSWPDSLSDPAQDHAARLLAIAEAQREPGCAPVALPPWLVERLHQMAAAVEDEDEDAIDGTRARLDGLIDAQVSRGRCPA